MRIQTNIESLNAYRNLNQTNRQQSESMERLSSGYRINRAADDAAGLAISEQMRGQISGLQQASSNAQDATSMIQTAEGALNESHEILQRMRELAVQSANDTLTEGDRAEIQEEVNELAEELGRIAETTEFNTQELLDGTLDNVFHIGANEGQSIELSIDDMSAEALEVFQEAAAGFEVTEEVENLSGQALADVSFENFGTNEYEVAQLSDPESVEGNYVEYAMYNDEGEAVAVSEDGSEYLVLEESVSDLGEATIQDDGTDDLAFDFGEDTVTDGTAEIEITEETGDIDTFNVTANATVDTDLEAGTYQVEEDAELDEELNDTYDISGDDTTDATHAILNDEGEIVALSADQDDWYSIEDFDDTNTLEADADPVLTSTEDLVSGDEIEVTGEGGIDVSTQVAADNAITTIDDAIETVSSERSELGAVQNRLDHTVSNLEVASENLQAAESRIRDTDMAAEMTEFTTTQILEEAGTAMLAQANQAPQSVLQLLG